tara:strand:- start:1582 stop:1923 length:342 start_codon:yes stop_codon:yes gene_type:complete
MFEVFDYTIRGVQMARADADSTTSDTDDAERRGDVGGGADWEREDARFFVTYIYATREEERWGGESDFVSADERVGDAIDQDLYSVERRIEVREISFFPLSRVFVYIAFIVRC